MAALIELVCPEFGTEISTLPHPSQEQVHEAIRRALEIGLDTDQDWILEAPDSLWQPSYELVVAGGTYEERFVLLSCLPGVGVALVTTLYPLHADDTRAAAVERHDDRYATQAPEAAPFVFLGTESQWHDLDI